MKKVKKSLIFMLAAIMALSIIGCGSNNSKNYVWPETGLAALLPEPASTRGEIKSNSDSRFEAEINRIGEEDYVEYRDACIDRGFNIEPQNLSYGYKAFNSDGYELSISYKSGDNYYTIYLYPPLIEEGSVLKWPSIGLATILPEPSSNVGVIKTDTSTNFSFYVGEFSTDDFNSYVDECISSGFDVDYDRSDTRYKAKNENDDKLTIEYEGFNVYRINLSAAKKSEDDEDAVDEEEADTEEEVIEEETSAEETDTEIVDNEEAEAQSQKSQSSDAGGSSTSGIDPDFKEALDSYEAFIDSYIAFMEKYENSNDTVSMLSEYLDYMQQYADMMEKISNLGDEEMSSEEMKYYSEVTLRCSKKLLESLE